MKIYFHNDTGKPMRVLWEISDDASGSIRLGQHDLAPHQGEYFEVAPRGENYVPWIKLWDNGVVRLMTISPATIDE